MNESPAPGPQEFATTHWSLVVAAKSDEASRSRATSTFWPISGIAHKLGNAAAA
jgi:hypothetical protein